MHSLNRSRFQQVFALQPRRAIYLLVTKAHFGEVDLETLNTSDLQKAFLRSKISQVKFTPGEWADLCVVGKHWDCGATTVCWLVTSAWLQGLRGREIFDLPYAGNIGTVLKRVKEFAEEGERIEMAEAAEKLAAEAPEKAAREAASLARYAACDGDHEVGTFCTQCRRWTNPITKAELKEMEENARNA